MPTGVVTTRVSGANRPTPEAVSAMATLRTSVKLLEAQAALRGGTAMVSGATWPAPEAMSSSTRLGTTRGVKWPTTEAYALVSWTLWQILGEVGVSS